MKIPGGFPIKRASGLSHKIGISADFMDDFSKESTIHGVKYFSARKRHWTEKLFWIVIFICSITFCVITALDVYKRRQDRPVMISFAKGLSSTSEIPFPAVTICPESKVSRSEIELSSIFSRPFSNLTTDEVDKLKALAQVCDFNELGNYSEFLKSNHLKPVDVIKLLDDMGNSFGEMFDRCRYGSREMIDCSSIFSKIITDEGECYTFNMMGENDLFNPIIADSMKLPTHGNSSDWFLEKEYKNDKLESYPRRVLGSGLQSGLSLELRMKRSNLNAGCKRGIQGFRLALHNPAEIPHLSKHFFSIQFEKQTTISVMPDMMYSSKDIKSYEPNNRQCYFQGERKLKFFKTYSKSSCEWECLSQLTLTSCGCVAFSMPRENSTKICDLQQLKCVHDVEITYVTRSLEYKLLNKHLQRDLKYGVISRDDPGFKKLKSMESCNCLPSCTSLKYNAEISQTDFIIDNTEEFATASVNIYFKSPHFTRLKRYEIYGFSDFLSSIGGVFGLFLGCSVLSFIEVIYLMFAYCVKRIKNSTTEMRIASENPVI